MRSATLWLRTTRPSTSCRNSRELAVAPRVKFLLALLLLSASCLAEETSVAVRGRDYAFLKALFLALIHLTSPLFRPWLKKRLHLVGGFGAGMAVSYVFIHLLPEVGEVEFELGKYIYVVVLLGFLFYLYLNRPERSRGLSLGGYWFYNWLLIYSMPTALGFSLAHSLLIAVAVVLHLLHQDFEYGHRDGDSFDRRWRYALALAPLLGALTRHLYLVESPGAVLTALMAGALMYTSFGELLGEEGESDARSFMVGVVSYTVLLIGADLI